MDFTHISMLLVGVAIWLAIAAVAAFVLYHLVRLAVRSALREHHQRLVDSGAAAPHQPGN